MRTRGISIISEAESALSFQVYKSSFVGLPPIWYICSSEVLLKNGLFESRKREGRREDREGVIGIKE